MTLAGASGLDRCGLVQSRVIRYWLSNREDHNLVTPGEPVPACARGQEVPVQEPCPRTCEGPLRGDRLRFLQETSFMGELVYSWTTQTGDRE
jgi:hypothetical protein